MREFEADWFTQPNFSLIEVRQESIFYQLLPSDALLLQMFVLSLSSSVCSVVLLVQVITFDYRYG